MQNYSVISGLKIKRNFLPQDFSVTTWELLEPFYSILLKSEINSCEQLKIWIKNRNEIDSIVSEDFAWRYIKMNCNTADEALSSSFEYFIQNIEPKLSPITNELNKKFVECSFSNDLEGSAYKIYLRSIKRSIELFREENIPLFLEINTLQQEYGKVCSEMLVNIDNKEYTLQQAAKFLEKSDRKLRKEVYETIVNRRYLDKEKLDELLNKLIKLRHQVALNSGYTNFRDYMHDELGRFDYTVQDCLSFHESIKKNSLSILDFLADERKKELTVQELFPYDLEVDASGKDALKPFENSLQLIEKTIETFGKLNPFIANCIFTMQKNNYLDLDSRKNKAPGGFNYPLMESGIPFIYMNSVGSQKDLVTMVHEGGHALHSFLCNELEISGFKNTPMEVAELASMSMELLSMEYWDVFFENKEELKRAKIDQLEKVLETLPWVAAIDKFQHWLYLNHTHSNTERENKWNEIYDEFSSSIISFKGYENFKKNMWQKQLHIYEVPFYYIEYGIAQLGAIAIWRNFKLNKEKSIEQYMNALKLGYSKTIKEIYSAAGIKFDFSESYVKELLQFTFEELKKLKNE
jgi:oligoendopeptidase F